MLAVDTNVLVRFLTRDDPKQDLLARSILLTGETWIGKTVLLETEWVLRSVYKFRPAAVHHGLSGLIGLPGVEVEDRQAVTSALEWFAEGMDFADALHLASRPSDGRFVTFDDSLVRQARKAGITGVAVIR